MDGSKFEHQVPPLSSCDWLPTHSDSSATSDGIKSLCDALVPKRLGMIIY